MTLKKSLKNNIMVLSLSGELDMYNSTDFRQQVDGLLGKYNPRGLLMNFRDLSYVDSSGIGLLLALLKRTNKMNCLTCFCYIQDQVLEIIKLTRILSLFDIKSSEKRAFDYIENELSSRAITENAPITINEDSPLMNRNGMEHKTINIDFSRIRYISHIITQEAPSALREYNLLEQQISEVIKNGVRHGNRNDINKALRIWWEFTDHSARLIVEDEGEGFTNLENWIDFYHKRMECFSNGDFDSMTDYLSYRTEDSRPEDGGNALFAAVEYWNKGVVFNKKKNCIAVKRDFKA
ncbi:MAG: anti-sigma factor antagonist [Spirochaetales bacterium]|nr:anti-sigma factor antagonist [Spirochaetales bacterium]